jgi:hypothetical protein
VRGRLLRSEPSNPAEEEIARKINTAQTASQPALQAATATSGWRRRIAACTKKVIRPPAARHAARKSLGAIVLPVASRIHGTTFCAMKAPRLPTELIAASAAAAEAPVKNDLRVMLDDMREQRDRWQSQAAGLSSAVQR